MAAESNLQTLLGTMQPKLLADEFVFCTVPETKFADLDGLNPLAMFREDEGLSLILEKSVADGAGLEYQSVFRAISLTVHSSLDAVGFTAAITTKLTAGGVSANVVAAHYHDHVLVPADKSELALQLLAEFNDS